MTSTTRGFTLLELVIVVAILGLLAGLVAPRVAGRTDAALRTRAEADLQVVAQALALYRLDAGAYPTTEQGLAALVERPAVAPPPRAWNPRGYLETVPRDPWGHPYDYASDGTRWALRSFGADGVEGGRGRDGDVAAEGGA